MSATHQLYQCLQCLLEARQCVQRSGLKKVRIKLERTSWFEILYSHFPPYCLSLGSLTRCQFLLLHCSFGQLTTTLCWAHSEICRQCCLEVAFTWRAVKLTVESSVPVNHVVVLQVGRMIVASGQCVCNGIMDKEKRVFRVLNLRVADVGCWPVQLETFTLKFC